MSSSDKRKTKDPATDSELLNLALIVDEFEGYESPHASRIADLSVETAKHFNFASHDLRSLYRSALVHDLGKLMMNRDYIQADRLLTEEEKIDLQRHPVIGEQEAAKRGLSRAVQLLVRWHHEWWNGSGYPDGLENEQIPLAARILRVVDTYVALTEIRPYSIPISDSEAKRYLTEWAGIEFDPKVVKIFLSLDKLSEIDSDNQKAE